MSYNMKIPADWHAYGVAKYGERYQLKSEFWREYKSELPAPNFRQQPHTTEEVASDDRPITSSYGWDAEHYTDPKRVSSG